MHFQRYDVGDGYYILIPCLNPHPKGGGFLIAQIFILKLKTYEKNYKINGI